ncbi:elongation factor P [Patescibacteria group bacterium]|jgi:elongation factor P|nr:elongation factor P [Patescibacteria group bacterium]MDQ5919445.1 elongation factor [Patescibacteria group bacterium]
MASPSDIKKGVVVKNDQGLWLIVEFQHINPGKGAAFVRSRQKNLQTGKVLEVTNKTSESIDIVEVEHRNMQYLFHDATGYTFMDNGSYEQYTMPDDEVGPQSKYLREGLEVHTSLYDNRLIAIEIPRKMTFKVVEAPEAVAGNTASGGNMMKDAIIDGGISVRVPLFIKTGEMIIVNTETDEYVERAK